MTFLVLLVACSPRVTALETSQADDADALTALSSSDATTEDRILAAESRMAALESRLATAEGALTAALARVEALEGNTAIDARLEELEGEVGSLNTWSAAADLKDSEHDNGIEALQILMDNMLNFSDGVLLWQMEQEAALADLEADVADLEASGGGGSGSSGLSVWSLAESVATGGGTAYAWEGVTADLELTLTSTETVVVWCTVNDLATYSAYQVAIEAADGSWSDEGAPVGERVSSYLVYRTEVLTVMGAFSPPAAGDYNVSCEGYGASPSEVTLIAIQGG